MYRNLHVHDENETRNLLEKAKRKDIDVCVWGAGTLGKGFVKEILAKKAIQIDYYCDSNRELLNSEIVDGILCYEKEKLLSKTSNTICILALSCSFIGSVYKQLTDFGVKNIITYDDLLELEEVRGWYLPFITKKKIAIYSCITKGYDELQEPEEILDSCDYYLLSEEAPKGDSIYQWIDINKEMTNGIINGRMLNRYCKINAHKFFQDYQYSIYFDGNLKIKGNIDQTIHKLKKTRIGVFGSNYSENPYIDALRCMKVGLACPEKTYQQVERYWNQGMPENVGSFLCGILVREHNNPICVKIMEDWWTEVRNNCMRDQVSFPYVLWKNGYTKQDVMLLCEDPRVDLWKEHPYCTYDYGHRNRNFHQATGGGIM